MSKLEDKLMLQIHASGLPFPEKEFRFSAHHVGGPGNGLRQRLADAGLKDWRFDFCWPDKKFAVEVEGGAWIGGRHNRGKGFEDDLVKYHHAMSLGFTVYRCSANLIDSGRAIDLIERLISE